MCRKIKTTAMRESLGRATTAKEERERERRMRTFLDRLSTIQKSAIILGAGGGYELSGKRIFFGSRKDNKAMSLLGVFSLITTPTATTIRHLVS